MKLAFILALFLTACGDDSDDAKSAVASVGQYENGHSEPASYSCENEAQVDQKPAYELCVTR